MLTNPFHCRHSLVALGEFCLLKPPQLVYNLSPTCFAPVQRRYSTAAISNLADGSGEPPLEKIRRDWHRRRRTSDRHPADRARFRRFEHLQAYLSPDHRRSDPSARGRQRGALEPGADAVDPAVKPESLR